MNYMPVYDDQCAEPEFPFGRRLSCNFDTKRAGRAIANLHLETVGSSVMIVPDKLLGRTCDVTLVSDPLQSMITRWDWPEHELAFHGDEVAIAPAQLAHHSRAEGDFTADEWAALGEEVGSAKRGLLGADVRPMTTTITEADRVDSEPMIRLGALSMRGNPMRPRRRAA
jgi:hypothetical protein